MAVAQTGQWSSRFAFILTAVGSAVGLGNLWRFSAEAGNNGGGAFISVYLVCVLLIGIPTLMAEFLIGRAGRASSVVNSMEDLAERSKVHISWSLGAWVGMISSFLILSFYAVVAAWVMAYIPKFLFGTFNGLTPPEIAAQFDVLIASPFALAPWFLLFLGLAIWLVGRGVNEGLEVAARLLMPAFFTLLFGLSLYSLYAGWESGGTARAIEFMFTPDWDKISIDVVVRALGQAFFSIGLGMAMMIAYGSYLPSNISIPQSSLIIGLSDTGVALIAGLAIFPIVFHFGLDFTAGAGLFFQTLPTALTSI
ncbi:MAG: sodium-dependent transporter, partial [Pseudomonadota bacterium]